MRYRAEAVDPTSMSVVRDITSLITQTDSGFIERSTANELLESGAIDFAGNSTWMSSLIRITAYDDEYQTCLGTFFATPQDCIQNGKLIVGKIQLDSVLLALSSTLLPSLYVAAPGISSYEIISDMCRLAGRAEKLDRSIINARFSEAVFYEPGASCLSVAREAAKKAGVELGTDRFGYITCRKIAANAGAGRTWTTGSSGNVISEISKTSSWMTSPTRIIAVYTDTDTTLSATARIPASERDSQTRGRNVDAKVTIQEIATTSPSTIRGEAEKALGQNRVDFEWVFTSAFQDCDAGDPAIVRDIDNHETMSGEVAKMRISLNALMSLDMTIRGEVI